MNCRHNRSPHRASGRVSRATKVIALALGFGLLFAAAIEPAFGQPGGRRQGGQRDFGFGFGGNRFQPGGGGLFGPLRQDEVQAELKLTDEQKQTVSELSERSRPSRDVLEPFFTEMRSAETEEERELIRAEIQQLNDKTRRDAEAELKAVLSAEQFARLTQLALQQSGPRALLEQEVADELKLTEEQRQQVQELIDQRDQAMRELGFRASREEREQLRSEWDTKVLGVLSADQRQAWQDKLGPPPAVAEAGNSNPAPGQASGRPAVTSTNGAGSAPSATDGDSPSLPVIASFGVETKSSSLLSGAVDKDAADNRPQPAGKLTFNFRYAPWADVLKLFAEASGLTLDLNDVPPGTFNYYDDGEYTPAEALDILNGYLLQKGYVLVHRDEFLVSLNIDKPIPPNLVPNVTVDELAQRGRNELLTVIFPLDELKAEDAGKEVEALLGPQGKVVALVASNSLVVTDIGANLRRIHRLLSSAIVRDDPNATVFRAFALRHVAATDAERIVRNLLGLSSSVPNVSRAASGDSDRGRGWGWGFPGGDSRSGRDGRSDGDSSRSSSSNSRTASANTGNTQVTADLRTNSLLVTATAAQMKIVEQAVEVLDVDDGTGGRFVAEDTGPYFRVYTVESAESTEVAKTLEALMPGVVVNEDGRYDRLHINATAAEHRRVEELIRQMDGAAGGQAVAVLSLVRLDAVAAAGTLRSLFIRDGDRAPTIEADALGRRLLVRGSVDQIAQVRTLLSELGESGDGRFASNDPVLRGPVRTLSLGGRDPQEFVRLLERLWEASNPNPIRIVVPSQLNPIRDRRVPNAGDAEDRPVSDPGPEVRADDEPRNLIPVSQLQEQPGPDEADNVEDSPAAPADEDQPAEASRPSISVTVQGGNLIISSTDLDALDRMERLVDNLAQTIPARMTWTVFYLRTADATETAAILEQLFPSSTVANVTTASESGLLGGLTSGINSFGRGLMDMTGLADLGTGPLTLRIIPEVRSNALFVSGPPEKVRDLEQMLKILDSNELPESLRDRLPRMIPVEYANASDVAAIVSDVYSDYMGRPDDNRGGGSRGGGNPFEMFMAARGGGNDNNNRQRGRSQPEVRLTLSVDTRTNQLVVSANDTLYREISALVESLDLAAYEAQQTVRVVALDYAEATTVQQALTSMIPNVRVSVAGESARPARSPSSGGASAPEPQSDGRPNSDDMRRFFEQRMRERMEAESRFRSGGDGGRSFGGGSGPPSFGRGFGGGPPSFGRGDGDRSDSRGRGR